MACGPGRGGCGVAGRTSVGRVASAAALAGIVLAACTIEQDLTPRVDPLGAVGPEQPDSGRDPTEGTPPAEQETAPDGEEADDDAMADGSEPSGTDDGGASDPTSATEQSDEGSRPDPGTEPTGEPDPDPEPEPEPEPGNRAPVAAADTTTVDEDGAVVHDVLANDEDPDGDALTLVTVSSPDNGTAGISSGRVRYVPAPNFHGSDAFTYTVDDGRGGTDTTTVSVTVVPVNDAPVAQPDGTYLVQEGATVILSDLLENDDDVDGDDLVVELVEGGDWGTVSLVDDTTVEYSHGGSTASGSDVFRYRANDGTTFSDPTTVTLDVNRAPVASNDRMVVRSRGEVHVVNVITGTAIANCCSGPSESWMGGVDDDPDPSDSLRLAGPLAWSMRPSGWSISCTTSGRCEVYVEAACSDEVWDVFYSVSDGRGGTDGARLRIESFHTCID